MRVIKYVLSIAAVVAVLATIAWFLRDTLIQRISNPRLQEYGIAVTDVSLDALAADNASISYLQLTHDQGTTIDIEGLTLPIGTTPGGGKNYAAEKVSIKTAGRKDGPPFELALLIEQSLSLHATLGDSTLFVREFNLPPYPVVRDLHWDLTGDKQKLSATVAAIAMSATITHVNTTATTIVFSIPEHSVNARMQQNEQGFTLSGGASLELSAWEPVVKLAGIVPQEIGFASGNASLQFDVDIPDDTERSPSVSAELVPLPPLQLTYSSEPDDVTSITVNSSDSVNIAASFPKVEWSLRLARASVLVTDGDWTDIPVSIDDLSCESGPACTMKTRISMDAARLPPGDVRRLELVAAQNVVFAAEGLSVSVAPNATIELTGLVTPGTQVGSVTARLLSSATLEFTDAGWQLAAKSLDANLEAVSVADDIAITTALFLENVSISELDRLTSVQSGVYAPRSEAVMNEQAIVLPGFKGELARHGADLAIDLRTVGLFQDGEVKARYDLDSGAGRLVVSDAAVSFAANSLSNRVSSGPQDWDLTAGTVTVDLDTSWKGSPSGLTYDGRISARIDDLAGYYRDTAFVGFSTTLESDFDSTAEFGVKPSTLSVALLDTGLPVEDISADYTLDLGDPGFEMENLRMTAFGGVIRAAPFSFHTERDVNTLVLSAAAIELDALLTLREFEAIEVSGSIGAKLPVRIEGDVVTIVDGTLQGEPPGGVIRYLPGLAVDVADASSIGLVTRALSNFEYESLTSEVSYNTDGDLALQLHLTGRNPDLDENRPVVLNLGVESNIPQMLKSLRAARAVEDILEKRLLE